MLTPREEDAIIRAMIKACLPIQWFAWWNELDEGALKEKFEAILFKNDELRDLTDPQLREDVLGFCMGNYLMREIIVQKFFEAAAENGMLTDDEPE